jgi:hypothetical protein
MSDQTQASPKEAILPTDVEGSGSLAELAPSSVSDSRRLCLLSNGTYSVMLSDSGSGFSRWRDLSVTRWREDATCDSWGSYLLLRDEDSGAVWSATQQPLGAASQDVVVNFSAGLAKFVRRSDALDCTLEIAVAVEADIELRRLTLRNHGEKPRTLSVTSYTELVVGPAGADNAHPAFSKMFVQTEWDARRGVILANRRRRANGEPGIWAAHALQIEGRPADRALDTRPIARNLLADAARCAMRWHYNRVPPCRTPPAACSILSSACANESCSHPVPAYGFCCGRNWPIRVRARWH